MPRPTNLSNRTSPSSPSETAQVPNKPILLSKTSGGGIGSFWDMLAIRLIFTVVCVAAGYHFRPFSLSHELGSAAGLLFAVAVILFEIRLRRASLRRLIGAVIGSIMGILGAFLTTLVLVHTSMPESTRSFVSLAVFLVMAYIGLIVGANKGDMLNLQALGGLFGTERGSRQIYKVLDTSVIIDGRVVDIAEAHFVDGTIIIPQFVLRELQMVADSADQLRRQRGRRGLEVLQRIQKMPHLDVQIAEDDFPNVPEVDMKLIELAKRYDAKIITNDFNLNKVATLQGIEILNVNQLANALKPVVLPGETMRVFILREGKEYNQGVAYLDDGTMVVVDGARKMINKTVDIIVTSVHQTTAGKMIFGRFDDRSEQAASRAAQGVPTAALESPLRPPVPELRAAEPPSPPTPIDRATRPGPLEPGQS
ncbi:MAG TPA: PIN domain-containing protein [Candidatus Acidoferrales bacterium]|nr:PIN domain-containing protein [Candidatus Acidoferrales bacterium]